MTEGNAAKVGIIGLKSLKGVGMGDKRIAVLADVGELDFLGYYPGWRLECAETPPSPCAIGQ